MTAASQHIARAKDAYERCDDAQVRWSLIQAGLVVEAEREALKLRVEYLEMEHRLVLERLQALEQSK